MAGADMTLKDRTLSLLRSAPDGLTMLEIAARLPEANKYTVSSLLSRMAAYGHINCDMRRANAGVPRKWNVYSLKGPSVLSPHQIEARKGKLTASRVACLMTGDAEKILRLYREMIGEELPEDLSDVWPVRLGETTEQLNLDWYEMGGNRLIHRGLVVVHPKFEWAAATLDAWDDILHCPVETKHVGGREPLEVIIDRYQPQMQWQMECTGATQCGLSVIMGANAPVVEYIERDIGYSMEMVKRGAQFMNFVSRREPPVVLDPVAPPVDATKTYDMSGSNIWGSMAAQWLATKDQAVLCKDAEKVLKGQVPADAKKCHGFGCQITRNRAGSLSLREIV
jgi:hypothetical protein